MSSTPRIAFYDFDGTLVSSNIVTRYAYLVRRLPSRTQALWKFTRLLTSVPSYLVLERISRRYFNEVFFREYRGMKRAWLEEQAERLFAEVVQPSIYPGAKALLDADRDRGFFRVLVTGELDFVLGPVMRYFEIGQVISNSLVFENGVATGQVVEPLIAEEEKVKAMARICRDRQASMRVARAYSDSFSDLPMLEAVGEPAAVHPDRRLKGLAAERRWPVLNLKNGGESRPEMERGNHAHIS
ncbi:MAG: HAD family hydrolase [Terriglobia bacterium]